MKILWIPHTGWHIPQRAHLFCHALAEKHEVHVTDWVADFASIKDYLSPRYLLNFTYRCYKDGNITVHGIPRISPAIYSSLIRQLNTKTFSIYVERLIKRFQIDIVVGTFVVSPPDAPRVIFDIFDDNPAYWREFAKNQIIAKEVSDIEREWISKSDHIITVSSVLRDKVLEQCDAGRSDHIRIIPNGIDLPKYRSANGSDIRKKYGIEGRKVVGFISNFGQFSGLLRYIEAIRIMDMPEVSHLIVGSGELLESAKELAAKYKLANVIFAGQVDFDSVANYYAAIDVGVIPFDLADFTHSSLPIKLLEYLACGKVVVSTPLEEIRRLNFNSVLIAPPEPEKFAAGIKQSLQVTDVEYVDLEQYDRSYLTRQIETFMQEV